MYKQKLDEEVKAEKYNPSQDILKTIEYVDRRIREMQDYRKTLKIENEWRDADREYIPHELDFGNGKKRFEADQITGTRSRLVPVGDATKSWRSNNSSPTLLTKIQTALAIIVDNDPKGMLVALKKKYEATTALAEAIWKRNWSITGAKQTYKLFAFDQFKYGWAVMRVFPRIVKYKKRVLDEIDTEDPTKNKYKESEIVWFNDVDRQVLDPYRTWIDEQTRPYDQYSLNTCYYEIDYTYDAFEAEFKDYEGFNNVPKDSRVIYNEEGNVVSTSESNERKDIVTVGFFSDRLKDLHVIYIPKHKIVLHSCPVPNDDGLLEIVHTPLMLRSSKSPYGISLWQVIRQDKELYDKMDNMTMDQLVLSIMKFGYHTGTNLNLGDGHIAIEPGTSRQINGEVNWMEIPGPGQEAWRGLEYRKEAMDDSSGITPTLMGDTTAGTLGQSQIEQETSLKRLKTPIENIAYAIEQDAYATLSWSSQILSTPEIKEFTTEEELQAYNEENDVEPQEIIEGEETEEGEVGSMQALYYPELALHLEDRDGRLIESKKSRFFQVGADIDTGSLRWRGIFKVVPKSLIGTSETIIRMTKLELADRLIPLLQMPPELVMKTATQIIKVNEEDPEDWLPDVWLNPPTPEEQMMQQMQAQGGMPPEGEEQAPEDGEQPLFTPMQGQEQPPQEEQPLFVPSQEAPAQEQPLFVKTA